MMEGYVPDSFGCIAALPSLLNGFDIDTANFSRGNPGLEQTECMWTAPDGSKVACTSHGYGNGLFLSYPDIWVDIFSEKGTKIDYEKTLKDFLAEADRQLSRAAAPVVYFSVGLDHMEPRESLIGVVNYIRSHQDRFELVYGTAQDYMREVKKYALLPYEGEVRGTEKEKRVDAYLNGTLTTRMDVKIANITCERMLQYVLEPIWTCVDQAGLGTYPKGELDRLWKAVIACHPHDSICGCSLDAVHQDMLSRFRDIWMTGTYLRDEGIRLLAGALQGSISNETVPVMVFKGGGGKGNCLVDQIIRIPRRFRSDSYRLTDENGREIPVRVQWICDKNKDLESVYMTRELIKQVLSKSSPDDRPDDQVYSVMRIAFCAENMPQAGWKCFNLSKDSSSFTAPETEENILKNEYVLVALQPDGTFDICDLASNKWVRGLNAFVDRLESGDSYAHHEPEDPMEIKGVSMGWKKTVSDSVEMRAETEICVGDRAKVTLCVSVWKGIRDVRVSLTIDNLKDGHCLRARFPEGGLTTACDHGVLLTRPPCQKGEWLEHPFTDYLRTGDLTLFQGTLTAYEGDCVELMRSTNHLGSAAGADHPAADGRLIGKLHHEYALSVNCTSPMSESALYHAGCIAEAGCASEDGILPYTNTLFELSGAEDMPVVSLKKAWDGKGFVVRAFNMGEKAKVMAMGSMVKAACVSISKLSEKEEAKADTDEIPVRRFSPLTLRLENH